MPTQLLKIVASSALSSSSSLGRSSAKLGHCTVFASYMFINATMSSMYFLISSSVLQSQPLPPQMRVASDFDHVKCLQVEVSRSSAIAPFNCSMGPVP